MTRLTICLQGKGGIKPISIVQELLSEASESEDELFTIEQVGTVKYDQKGKFFVRAGGSGPASQAIA